MKQIYKIGTKQDFTYTIPAFLKKNIKVEEHWVIRNVKYIYASSEEEAKEKYTDYYFVEYENITNGWGDWYLASEGANLLMHEELIDITKTTIIIIQNGALDVNYMTLKNEMPAEDFKEWWFHGRMAAISI